MFTGLVAELGTITSINKGETSAVFTINAPVLISEIKEGDSVAVSGVCLTATSVSGTTFTADVMVQTLALTSLSQAVIGSPVNLELAALATSRLGGHIVQGHVDGVAKVIGLTPGDKWAQFDVEVTAHLSKYNCRPGQRVKRGDIIGYVGSTGRSQAPHLHYEVFKGSERVNPLNFYYGSISAKEYIEISKLANQENQSLD